MNQHLFEKLGATFIVLVIFMTLAVAVEIDLGTSTDPLDSGSLTYPDSVAPGELFSIQATYEDFFQSVNTNLPYERRLVLYKNGVRINGNPTMQPRGGGTFEHTGIWADEITDITSYELTLEGPSYYSSLTSFDVFVDDTTTQSTTDPSTGTNNPPEFLSTVQTTIFLDQEKQRNYATRVIDDDGDELLFEAFTYDSSIAVVEVTESIVRFIPVAPGSTQVEVTASDGLEADTLLIDVTVPPQNQLPIIDPIPPVYMNTSETPYVDLRPYVRDPDNSGALQVEIVSTELVDAQVENLGFSIFATQSGTGRIQFKVFDQRGTRFRNLSVIVLEDILDDDTPQDDDINESTNTTNTTTTSTSEGENTTQTDDQPTDEASSTDNTVTPPVNDPSITYTPPALRSIPTFTVPLQRGYIKIPLLEYIDHPNPTALRLRFATSQQSTRYNCNFVRKDIYCTFNAAQEIRIPVIISNPINEEVRRSILIRVEDVAVTPTNEVLETTNTSEEVLQKRIQNKELARRYSKFSDATPVFEEVDGDTITEVVRFEDRIIERRTQTVQERSDRTQAAQATVASLLTTAQIEERQARAQERVRVQKRLIVESEQEESSSTVVMTIEPDEETNVLEIIEVIPKEMAASASELRFNIQPIILEDDPVVMWQLEDIDEPVELTYAVDKEVDIEVTGNTIALLDQTPDLEESLTPEQAVILKEQRELQTSSGRDIVAPLLIIPIVLALIVYYGMANKKNATGKD